MDAPFPEGLTKDIETFLTEVHPELKSNQDLYPEVFKTNLFYPLQRQEEMKQMMKLAKEVSPEVVYEIGADKGGGLYHWCQLDSVRKVIACEIRGTPYRELFERAFPFIDFLWIEDSSYAPETVREVNEWLEGDGIDCLFIDGDKGQFRKDFDLYLPMMNPDGIVFMHDVQDSPPRHAFESLKPSYITETIILKEDYIRLAQQVAQGYRATTAHENWLLHWKGRSCGVGVIYLGKDKG